MQLVEIDPVGAEPLERRVDRLEHVPARQAAIVGIVGHGAVELGRDHDLMTCLTVVEKAAEDLLAFAQRILVGGVEEIDPGIERRVKKRTPLFFRQHQGRQLWSP